MSDEVDRPPPDYSLVRDHRLVAYVWRREGGHLRRAGQRSQEPVCELLFGEIVCFDAQREQLLAEVAGRSTDLDAFLFKIQVEGLEIVDGTFTPDPRFRRF